jgi:hypothetical protein
MLSGALWTFLATWYQNCPRLKSQESAAMKKCTTQRKVNEDVEVYMF